jgi:glycosyltransferase involved in cell wall biosynthesis
VVLCWNIAGLSQEKLFLSTGISINFLVIKVLSIVPYKIFPAKVGGQKGIALFNDYLSKICELECVTVKSNDPKYAIGYKVMNVLPGKACRYIDLFLFFTLQKLIDQQGFSHLILEHPYYGWLGVLLKKFTGIKLVIHSHNIESTRWKSLGKWWWKILWNYERITHRHADYNFFIHDADKVFALREFHLDEKKCTTITYGIEIARAPSEKEKLHCSNLLRHQHHIKDNETIYLFNGALDYRPNLEAVKNILEKINPFLLAAGFSYKIIICGRGLPEEMDALKNYTDKNIIYAGFVDDISVYFKGADVFINPVVEGGGIKTKMGEALGYNTKVVSTKNGSIGVATSETGGQLKIVPDSDWQEFALQMMQAVNAGATSVPESFYIKFYWGNIVEKALAFISH